jgi:hypothetical protein
MILSMTNHVLQKDWKLVKDCRWRRYMTDWKLLNFENNKLDEVQKEDKKEEVE